MPAPSHGNIGKKGSGLLCIAKLLRITKTRCDQSEGSTCNQRILVPVMSKEWFKLLRTSKRNLRVGRLKVKQRLMVFWEEPLGTYMRNSKYGPIFQLQRNMWVFSKSRLLKEQGCSKQVQLSFTVSARHFRFSHFYVISNSSRTTRWYRANQTLAFHAKGY